MTAEISIEGLPQGRTRLAALPRREVEGVCINALMDAGGFAAGIIEMARLISEAQTFLKKFDLERADIRLCQALAYSGNPPAAVTP